MIPWTLNDKILISSFKVDGDAQIVMYCESHEKLMQGRKKVWKHGGVWGGGASSNVIRLTDLLKSGGVMPPCPPVSDSPVMSN